MLEDILFGGFTFVNAIWVTLNGYNFVPLLPGKRSEKEQQAKEAQDELPISVLLPAYQESNILETTVDNIEEAKYPKSKLELLLLTEDDDTKTREVADRLAKKYDNIKTVNIAEGSAPKGKPRALVQALAEAKGDIIGVLDAEDIIDRNLFSRVNSEMQNPDYGALQGRLRLNYNKENWLVSQFRAEYEVWYQTMLPAFESKNYPLPLGGTTNFFRKDLINVMKWNPYSLTEDFELALRMYNKNYKVRLIDLVTDEQTPPNLKSWIKQRSRWDRGKLQAAKQLHTYSKGLKHRFMSYMLCATPYIGVVNLFGIAASSVVYGLHAAMPIYDYVLSYTNAASLGVYFYLQGRGYFRSSHKSYKDAVKSVALGVTLPAYWLLQWAAGIRAIKQEFFDKRIVWEKTPHYKLNKKV